MEKVLLIANPHAGSVTMGRRQAIVASLRAGFKLEVADTTRRGHATELARDAVDRDFDAVCAFGGDGTINEVMQALVTTDVALGILPGGSTNVTARALGMPRDPVEATAFLGSHLKAGTTRRVNVGRINDRYFLFSAGMGFDAEVVRRVEADPERKRAHHQWLFFKSSLAVAVEQYLGREPLITLHIDDEEPVRVVTALCCNARPLSYFGGWPVDACPEAALEGGLDFVAFKRISWPTIPRFAFSLFVSRSHPRWSSVHHRHDATGARFLADQPLPVQVDGDYIGEWEQARVSLVPAGLSLVAQRAAGAGRGIAYP
jgi:diacylglycerol kinase family enzyme